MSDLQPIGVRAVVENVDGYKSAMDQLTAATNKTTGGMKTATSSAGSFDKILSQMTGSVGNLAPEAASAGEAMGGLGEAAGLAAGTIAAAAAAVAVVVAAVVGFIALAKRGEGFSEIENGFGRITASAGLASKTLLADFRAASDGTIADMQLMTTANQALIGVGKDFAKTFGQDLPQVMKVAKVVSEATGKDMTQTFDQITEAIRRGQTRMLMSSGIVINQKQLFDQYAATLGKTAAQLTFAEKQQAVLNGVLKEGTTLVNNLGTAAESNADKSQRLGTTVTNTFDAISAAVQPVWGAILDGLNAVVSTIAGIVGPIATYIGAVISLVSDGLRSILGPIAQAIGELFHIDFGGATKNFFDGGFKMIGALAKGILNAANTYVFPAVIAIAQGIADFLIGLSPPPKGPLSLIDQGGANVMESWITGFTGVSLDPVSQVAGQVAAAMGPIANETLDQVNAQLAKLDKSLAPFDQRLKIVSAQFDALKPAQDAAFRAIDRQTKAAQDALANGDQAAADTIKRLDTQRQQLQDYVDVQQEAVDNAQIQLSFAEAQQAQERAMLGIRKDQLTAEEKLQQAAGGGAAAKVKKPKEGGAGGGAADNLDEPAGGGLGGAGGAAGGFLGDINSTKTELMGSFTEGLGGTGPDSELGQATANAGKLKDALGQIGSVDIGSKLKEKFASVFDPAQDGSITNQIGKWWLQVFSPDSPVGIIAAVKKVPDGIGSALSGIGTSITTALNEGKTAFTKFAVQILDPSDPNSVVSKVNTFVTTDLPNALKGLPDAFMHAWADVGLQIGLGLNALLNPAEVTSLPFKIKELVTITLPAALAGLGDTLIKNLKEPFQTQLDAISGFLNDLFQGNIAGISIPAILDAGVAYFVALPDRIAGALATLGQKLSDSMTAPVKAALNSVLTAIHGLLAGVIDGLKRLVDDLPPFIKGLPGISDIVVGIMGIKIPDFTLAASGGTFGAGLTMVGERGPEMISASDKLTVFPNNFVNALDRLSSVMTRAYPAMQSAASYNNMTNIDRSVNATFNGMGDSGEAIRRIATMQAFS